MHYLSFISNYFKRGRGISFLLIVMAVICIPMGGCQRKDEQIVLSPVQSSSVDNSATDGSFSNENSSMQGSDISSDSVTISMDSTDSEMIFVHVCGAVKEEGIYELSADARIFDAIEAAGGFLDDADTDYVNQASKVTDGSRIRIPTLEETTALLTENGNVPEAVSSGNDSLMVSDGAYEESVAESGNGLININKASEAELCTITGIGESRARDIVKYRDEHGAFSKPEDIMNVTGIKEKLYEKIKDFITV